MQLHGDVKVLRNGNCVQSRQYRGVFMRVMHECEGLRIVRTEMDSGSALDNVEMGDSPAYHLVIEGNLVFRAADGSADVMAGDSIVFNDEKPYAILNPTPSRSVMLSVFFRTSDREACV